MFDLRGFHVPDMQRGLAREAHKELAVRRKTKAPDWGATLVEILDVAAGRGFPEADASILGADCQQLAVGRKGSALSSSLLPKMVGSQAGDGFIRQRVAAIVDARLVSMRAGGWQHRRQ